MVNLLFARKDSKKFGHDSDGIKFFKRFGVKVAAVTADKRDRSRSAG